MKDVYCPYCMKKAVYTDSAEIYGGRSYGMIYLCRQCDAYVGVHEGSDKPKGRLADASLCKLKVAAHSIFDPMWKFKTGPFYHRRKAAYMWLSEQMGLPVKETHIGMFDEKQCMQVIEICKKGLTNNE